MDGKTQPWKKILRRILKVCLAVYLIICAGCAAWQRHLIYFPPKMTPEQVDAYAQSVKLERWKTPAGECVGMKRASPIQPAIGQLLITYGNGSFAAGCARYADAIQQTVPLDVYILEYPGYADRVGSPSEKNIFQAADVAINLLTNKPVFLLGESLGTGVACYLAGAHPNQVAGVALLAPYNRLVDVAQYHMPVLPVTLLLVDRFDSQDHLKKFNGPIAIFVGGWDDVVPERFGIRLYDGYAGSKHLYEFPIGGHGSIMEHSPKEWKEVFDFFQAKK